MVSSFAKLQPPRVLMFFNNILKLLCVAPLGGFSSSEPPFIEPPEPPGFYATGYLHAMLCFLFIFSRKVSVTDRQQCASRWRCSQLLPRILLCSSSRLPDIFICSSSKQKYIRIVTYSRGYLHFHTAIAMPNCPFPRWCTIVYSRSYTVTQCNRQLVS